MGQGEPPRHRHEVADRQRLDVLAAQAAVALTIALVVRSRVKVAETES